MQGGEQQDSMGLAKSLRQSCPYGSVHVAGTPACRQDVPEHGLVVLCEPPSHLGLGSPFHFFSIFPPWESTWGQLVSPGLAGLSICQAAATGSLLGGCISMTVPFGHWVTSLLVAFAVNN